MTDIIQDSTLILDMVNAVHAKLRIDFPDADDATKRAACASAAELYQQAMIRDTMVATMMKAFGSMT